MIEHSLAATRDQLIVKGRQVVGETLVGFSSTSRAGDEVFGVCPTFSCVLFTQGLDDVLHYIVPV